MPRPPRPFKRKQIKVAIRESVLEAVRSILASKNHFDPSKPVHGAASELVEELLIDWLKMQKGEAFVQHVMSISEKKDD